MKKIKVPKKDVILFEPNIREINKEAMFMEKDRALARWDFIHNYFVKSLLNYDTEKAKAYKEILSDIKSLADNAKANIKFK